MVAKKHQSKRVAASHRYKIAKRVRDHHRKTRKEQRDNPKRGKKPTDPGIPAMLPFRDQVIAEVNATRDRIQTERAEAQQARRQQQVASARGLDDLVRDAAERQTAFSTLTASTASKHASNSSTAPEERDNSRKAFYKEFRKVVAEADVLLEVLDARDPLGCRVQQVEEMVREQHHGRKRIVLVLNKIDLVPRDVAEQWLTYLRRDFPTVAFKASTQQQRDHLGHIAVAAGAQSGSSAQLPDRALASSECVGGAELLKLLKNYCRLGGGVSGGISVGVIGFPNVGKSSVINSLKRARVCAVGNTPGWTRSLQTIALDKHVRLIDSPGIVFAAGSAAQGAVEAVLRNCVKVELLTDPVPPVALIVARCSAERLQRLYNIPPFADTADFLVQVARQKGRLRRGGIPDTVAAARSVLLDWNSGKIPFYTLPPAIKAAEKPAIAEGAEGSTAAMSASSEDSAAIVQSWGAEFDVEQMLQGDAAVLGRIKSRQQLTADFMPMLPGTSTVDMDAVPDMSDSSDAMEDDNEVDGVDNNTESTVPQLVTMGADNFLDTPASRRRARAATKNSAVMTATDKKSSKPIVTDAELELNPQRNKALRKQARLKAKQLQRRQERQLANTADAADVDAYDFANDFAMGAGNISSSDDEVMGDE